jgi:hypothetical protein
MEWQENRVAITEAQIWEVHRMMAVAVLVCGMGYASAQPLSVAPERALGRRRWIGATLLLVSAEVLDVASSRGAQEANPLLRGAGGQFNTTKAIALKGVFTGGALLFETLALRHHHAAEQFKMFAIANATGAVGLAAVAVHNFRVNSGPASRPSP